MQCKFIFTIQVALFHLEHCIQRYVKGFRVTNHLSAKERTKCQRYSGICREQREFSIRLPPITMDNRTIN